MSLRVISHTKRIMASAQASAPNAAAIAGRILQQQAQRNVAPGMGPGPHPHVSQHIDTGNLMRDIFMRGEARALRFLAHVGSTSNAFYGAILEMGWHSRSGRFFRYPWLVPALQKRRKQIIAALAKNLRLG